MVIFHSYVSLPEGNGDFMVTEWWFNEFNGENPGRWDLINDDMIDMIFGRA
jgi:hypothetical protein